MILIAGTWTRFYNFWTRNTLSDSPLMTPMWIAMVPVVIGALVLGIASIWGFVTSLHVLVSGAAPTAEAQED